MEINENCGMVNGEITQDSLITFDLHRPCRSAAGALQQGVAPTAARSHREPQRCPKKHPGAAPPFTAVQILHMHQMQAALGSFHWFDLECSLL